VSTLTGTEVRKDIRDIQRTAVYDSDSDCSVKSEDVLHSAYPVKPRRTPKNWVQMQQMNKGSDSQGHYHGIQHGRYSQPSPADTALADQAIQYIDGIKSSKRDLYDAEEERERLEYQKEVRFNWRFAPSTI